jgi:poly-gamma-glutamate biosynthesis protein PgsC/CapC
MLEVFIGVGIFFSLIYYEITEISPGGLISPIYIALFIDQPMRILGTVVSAVIISFLLKVLRNYLPLYGKRNFAVAVMLGILFKLLLGDGILVSYLAIGSVVSGLIGYECDKQGVLPTIVSLLISGIVLKLVLVLFQGNYFI